MRNPFFFILSFFCFQHSWSQSGTFDSLKTKGPEYYAVREYNSFIGLSSPLYNGIIHKGYVSSLTGIPYLLTTDWLPGAIVYEDVPYNDVFLKYDMLKDQVIIKRPDGFGIELFSPRIKNFTIAGHTFIYFPVSTNKASLSEGFYDQLQVGKINLYERRQKTIRENITNVVERKIIETDKFYVLQNGQYHFIKNLKALLALIPEKRKEIRTYLHKMKIKYNDDPELALNKVVEYYNQ